MWKQAGKKCKNFPISQMDSFKERDISYEKPSYLVQFSIFLKKAPSFSSNHHFGGMLLESPGYKCTHSGREVCLFDYSKDNTLDHAVTHDWMLEFDWKSIIREQEG